MLKRSWILPLILAAAVAVLPACSGGGKTSAGSSPEQKTPEHQTPENTPPAKKPDPVELTVYNTVAGGSMDTMLRDFGSAVQAKYPHISFKYMEHGKGTTIADLAATKMDVDIIMSTQGKLSELADAGLIAPISDLVKKHEFDLNRVLPSTLEPMKKISGDIVGLPYRINTLSLYYNKDIFNKFGVPFPNSPMTWDELYDLSRKMSRTEGGVHYHGLVFEHYPNMLSLNQHSYEMVDPKTAFPTFKDDYWKKSFDNLLRFYKLLEGKVSDPLALNKNHFIKDQIAAMAIITATSFPKDNETIWNFDWDIAPFPTFKELPEVGSPPAPGYLVVSGTSKHRDTAFQAIAQVLADEVQREFAKSGIVSSLKNQSSSDFGANVSTLKGKNVGALLPKKWANPMSWDTYTVKVQPAINKAFSDVVKGLKDPNTALQEAQEQAVKTVQEPKK